MEDEIKNMMQSGCFFRWVNRLLTKTAYQLQ